MLVVDDEPDILALLSEHLLREGLVVETAPSGRRALEALAAQVFDAVVSDLRMPDMDGRALLDAIDRDWPALVGKVILITGDALSLDLDSLPDGDVPIFEKPLDLPALTAAIRQCITGRVR